jgi:hypothetical protein
MTQLVILGKVCDVPWLSEIVYWIFAPEKVWAVVGISERSFKYFSNNLE